MKKIVVIAMLTGMVYLFAGCEFGDSGEPSEPFKISDAYLGFGLQDKKTLNDYFYENYPTNPISTASKTRIRDEKNNQYEFSRTDKDRFVSYLDFPEVEASEVGDSTIIVFYYVDFPNGDCDTIRIEFQIHPKYGRKWGKSNYFSFVNAYYNEELQYRNKNSYESLFYTEFLK